MTLSERGKIESLRWNFKHSTFWYYLFSWLTTDLPFHNLGYTITLPFCLSYFNLVFVTSTKINIKGKKKNTPAIKLKVKSPTYLTLLDV